MIKHCIQKYWAFLLAMPVFFILGYTSLDNFNDAMIFFFGMMFMGWIARMIVFNKVNFRLVIKDVGLVLNMLLFFWYVCSLKPLRRWIRRLRYVGLSPKPYPFLPLYGGLLDTHAMRLKFSSSFLRDKTPAARAALWRLLTRGAIWLNITPDGQPVLCLGQWTDSPSDGLDQDFEKCLYGFMAQCAPVGGLLDPQVVKKAISYYNKNRDMKFSYDYDNQYRYADLLNTGISVKAYNQREIQNIFGMRRFLKALPTSYLSNTEYAGRLPEISRIWPEYMTFAYLFGMERSAWRNLSQTIPPVVWENNPLLYLLLNSEAHRQLIRRMMKAVSEATLDVEDAVSAHRGRLTIAWHAEEIYDL